MSVPINKATPHFFYRLFLYIVSIMLQDFVSLQTKKTKVKLVKVYLIDK